MTNHPAEEKLENLVEQVRRKLPAEITVTGSVDVAGRLATLIAELRPYSAQMVDMMTVHYAQLDLGDYLAGVFRHRMAWELRRLADELEPDPLVETARGLVVDGPFDSFAHPRDGYSKQILKRSLEARAYQMEKAR